MGSASRDTQVGTLRFVRGVTNQYGAQGVFGESPGDQLAGSQPTRHYNNISASSGRSHMAQFTRSSDGAMVLTGLTSALAVETTPAEIVHRNAPGFLVEIPAFIGAVPSVTISGKTSAQIDTAVTALGVTSKDGMTVIDATNHLAAQRIGESWYPVALGTAL